MKIGVHIAGYSFTETPEGAMHFSGGHKIGQHQDSERVIWGEGALLGRIPTGLEIARDADFIIWSTGASWSGDGRREAHLMYDIAYQRYDMLRTQFPHRFNKRTWRSVEAYQRWLAKISMFDTVSHNTSQSMIEAQKLIDTKFRTSERVILYYVASANHTPRVVRDTLSAFKVGTADSPSKHRITLVAVAAETCYGHSTVDKTKVDDLGQTLFTRAEWEAMASRGVRESE